MEHAILPGAAVQMSDSGFLDPSGGEKSGKMAAKDVRFVFLTSERWCADGEGTGRN